MSGPVEVSGSTPLTQRLVEAATNAADKAEVEVYADRRLTRADLRYISESVAAAVLRELAVMDRTVKGGDAFLAGDFDALADSIERGE